MQKIDANTEQNALTAQPHGNKCGACSSSTRIPVGNGTPSSKPVGISSATTTAMRASSGRPSNSGRSQLTAHRSTRITAVIASDSRRM